MSELEDFLTQTEQNIIRDRLKEVHYPLHSNVVPPIHPNCRCWYSEALSKAEKEIREIIDRLFGDL